MSAAAKVSLVKTADRGSGVPQSIDLLGINPVKGKDVLLKPNFNTADPFPGSTHNDTLRAIIGHLRRMGSSAITVADRSGPADTSGAGPRHSCPRIARWASRSWVWRFIFSRLS